MTCPPLAKRRETSYRNYLHIARNAKIGAEKTFIMSWLALGGESVPVVPNTDLQGAPMVFLDTQRFQQHGQTDFDGRSLVQLIFPWNPHCTWRSQTIYVLMRLMARSTQLNLRQECSKVASSQSKCAPLERFPSLVLETSERDGVPFPR